MVISSPWARTARLFRSAATVLVACAALPGCSDSSRCPALAHCDVRTSACQASALRQAACLRGRDEPSDTLPAVTHIARADFLDALAESAPSDADLTFRRGLALLGLVPSDDAPDEASVAAGRLTAAYYDTVTQSVTIVDDDRAPPSPYALLTLVHEMVHVLQDRAGELPDDEPARFDARLARRAVSEGEATLLTDEAYVTGIGADIRHIGYGDTLASYGAGQYYAVRSAKYAFDELVMRFPYAEGARYVRKLLQPDGSYDSAQAFAAPPGSTRDVLARDPSAPDRYVNDLGATAVPVLDGLTLLGAIHLGAYAYDLVGDRSYRNGFGHRLPTSHLYRADTFSVFLDDQARVMGVWRIRYDSADSAEATRSALAALLDSEAGPALALRVGSDDTDVWLVLAESAEALAGAPDELDWVAADDTDYAFGAAAPAALMCITRSE